jgi:hypothetical protein
MGSSLESLNTGDKEFGEAFRPRILEGYFSTEDRETQGDWMNCILCFNFDVLEFSTDVILRSSCGQNG